VSEIYTDEILNNEQFSLPEQIRTILENYPKEFKTFFMRHCSWVVEFFSESKEEQSVHSWLFDESNHHRLPYKAKQLINSIFGLSLSTKESFSYMRQFRLADKLSISDRYLRTLFSKIFDLGLMISRRNRGINYKLTFDLNKSVLEYFQTLITTLFGYYSESISEGNSEGCSGSNSDFSLAKLLYSTIYKQFIPSESLKSPKTKTDKEIRGHAQPASNITNSGIPDSTTKSEETSDESERNFRTETSIEEIEPKGKFSLEIYLDFAKSEQLQKKNIKNINRFAEWLLIEGKQDNEVSKFVEAKKENLIGARTIDGAKSETRPSPVAPAAPAAPAAPTTRASKEEIAEVKQLLAIESLGVAAWESLEQTKQNKLFESVKAEVAKNPVCSKLTKEGLGTHIIGIIKEKLGKWAYKANVSDCGGILEKIGKEIFEGLDDDLQGELVGEKIELAGDEFYLSNEQGKLMEKMRREIYVELGIGEVAKL
jgi:hypothetical protein